MLNYICRRCISIHRGKFISNSIVLIPIFRINYCLFLFFSFLRSLFLTSFGSFCLRQGIRLCSLCFLDCFRSTISWLADAYFLLRLGITFFFIIFFFFLRFNLSAPTSLSCIALIIFSLHTFFLSFFLLAHLRRLNLISFLW